MAINIKNLQERIQKKIFSVSPSTPTADLGDIVEAATLATGSLRQYDSAGLLPSVTSTQAQIAYTKKDNAIKHKSANTTTWKTLTTDAYAHPVAPTPTSQGYQGDTYGFMSGGVNPGDAPNPGSTGPQSAFNIINRYTFASATNATDYGDLTAHRQYVSGASSSTHGYSAGGGDGSQNSVNVIDKFAFSAAGNATDVGDLTVARYQLSGTQSPTFGYAAGGYYLGPPSNYVTNIVDKFPFGSDGNASDVGDLTLARQYLTGTSSNDHGHAAGGTPTSGKRIDKYAFASDGNATDVGDTVVEMEYLGANSPSSPTHGYIVSGHINTFEKFPFASDGNSSDVADLLQRTLYSAGANSEAFGFVAGGRTTSSYLNQIQKFSHTADENSTDVADLTYSAEGGAGQQV